MLGINRQNIWHDRDSNPKPTVWEPSTGIFFAQIQVFWSTFVSGKKQNYCFDISFQRVLTNINSTTDLCTLCKRVSRFSVEKFSSHIAEKFRRGTRLCLRKFRVSKNFMPKRGISRFSIKNIVVSQYRKYFVGEPFFVSEKFWYRKNLWIRGGRGGGSITIFRQKMSASQCRKIS